MEPPTVSIAPDAEIVGTTPLTIEIPEGLRARGCTIGFPDDDKAATDVVDGFDVVVQQGGITVQVRRHDGSQAYRSSVLPETPDSYMVRLPEHIMKDARRIVIQNGLHESRSRFQILGWHHCARSGKPPVPSSRLEEAAGTGIGLRGFSVGGSTRRASGTLGDFERAIMTYAIATALDQEFPVTSEMRRVYSICEWIARRFDTSRIAVILPFAVGDAGKPPTMWLLGSTIARGLLDGSSMGDIIDLQLRDRASGPIDFLVSLDVNLSIAMLLSQRDLRSVSRQVRQGILISVGLDERLIGATLLMSDQGDPRIGTESARAALHECGFYDAAAITRIHEGSFDLDAIRVSRRDSARYSWVETSEKTRRAHPNSLSLAGPLLVATHAPLVASIDL